MRIVFLSNYFNHHQSEASKAWNNLTNGQYYFIETAEMREERRKLGYTIEKPSYVIPCFNESEKRRVLTEVEQADVVVCGSAPDELIDDRQRMRRLVFRYSERIYKDHYQWYKWPFRLVSFQRKFGRHKNTYLLCASAFTAADYAKHGAFLKKTYKWGYFPPLVRYDHVEDMIAAKRKMSILWCGRYLNWKHPEDALAVAKRLQDDGLDFEMNFIGTGELEETLRTSIREEGLEERVHLLGAMKSDRVRAYMEQAEIFLFTSDRHEGWGAVLNEAMNSGCAVVASHAIGSVPFMIEDNRNGCIYQSGNVDMLYKKVKYLLEHPDEREKIGLAAYQTVEQEWNAEVAAERLMRLAERIQQGEKHPDLYQSGPCSRATILRDNWYRD